MRLHGIDPRFERRIAGERKGRSSASLLTDIRAITGPETIAPSTVSVIELEHGIWRAKDAAQAARRRQFLSELFDAVPIHPLTFEIARRAASRPPRYTSENSLS